MNISIKHILLDCKFAPSKRAGVPLQWISLVPILTGALVLPTRITVALVELWIGFKVRICTKRG